MAAQMEKAAIAFINQISKTPYKRDDTAELMAEMPAAVAREVLQQLDLEDPRDFHELHQYSHDTAGSIMDRSVISINNTATVAEAIGRIRTAETDDEVPAVFVVDERGKYVGDVRIHKLLTRPEQARVDSLVNTDTFCVHVDTDKDKVRDIVERHNLSTIPVLNHNGQLVGRITADRVNGNGAKRRSIQR
jgi:magnesium transporter